MTALETDRIIINKIGSRRRVLATPSTFNTRFNMSMSGNQILVDTQPRTRLQVEQDRSRMQSRYQKRKRNRRKNSFITGALFFAVYFTSLSSTPGSVPLVCYAADSDSEDSDGNDNQNENEKEYAEEEEEEEAVVVYDDDFYAYEEDDYYVYTPAPTSAEPTPSPTATPTTPQPTSFPTATPSSYPSEEPTRAGDDFYEVQIDDYTSEAQSAEIYISSISDVILCLLCTFFWVLWLVGTIFPTKIQHLYRSEGIVVLGDVIESYVTHGGGSPTTSDVVEDTVSEFNGGDTFDALNNLPTHHAIVSYIVPGPIALGRRRKRVVSMNESPTNYYTENDLLTVKIAQSPRNENTVTDFALEELSQKLSLDHVRASMQTKLKSPPRPPNMSTRQLSKISEEDVKEVNDKSLLDSCTKSFDTTSIADKKAKQEQEDQGNYETLGFYKYNRNDSSDYTSNNEACEEEYENPELIGNLFHSFGLSGMMKGKEKKTENIPSHVRVKKRFETNEYYKQGTKNVEIIVLPGNPGSGILKSEFELEEDYLLNGTVSADLDDDADAQPDGNSGQMGDVTAGMIGVVLSAVSVIGAVHGALTLPYQTRACKFARLFFCLNYCCPVRH